MSIIVIGEDQDFIIRFETIALSDGTPITLPPSAAVITVRSRDSGTDVLSMAYSTHASRFTWNNTTKVLDFQVLQGDYDWTEGRYYARGTITISGEIASIEEQIFLIQP